jgi:hypothetical protein
LLTTEYPIILAQRLPSSWTLAQPLLTSSYTGFGIQSLASDVKELGECVSYFRKMKNGKIVLMGSSTGCQDIMKYLNIAGSPSVDGAINQASASDREAMVMLQGCEVYNQAVGVAQAMVARGEGEEIVPRDVSAGFCFSPVTARRYLSLASPNHDGDDDMFSSDLSEEQIRKVYGSLPAATPLCILYSGSDQFVPSFVDKQNLVRRWIAAIKAGTGRVDEDFSGVVDGASHTYENSPKAIIEDLIQRVIGFLGKL